jgi:hypothetical protein
VRPLFALAAACVLSLARTASGAPLDVEGTDWEGLADLVSLARSEVGRDRVLTPRKLDFEALTPADALLLVHPEVSLDAGEIENFISAGGRVALLDDYGTGSEVLAHFGIRRVPLPSNPERVLRSNPALALAEVSRGQALPDALRDLREAEPIVTNHATGLADTELLPLLVVRGHGEADVLLAVAGAVGTGHFLAIGDASVAMNSMLRYPGNRTLAVSLIRYLSEERGRSPSSGRLFVVANAAPLVGEFGPPTSVPKPVRKAVADAIEGLEQGMPVQTAHFVAVAIGLGIVLWASSRAGRRYKESLPRFVRPTPVAAQGGFAGRAAVLVARSPQGALVELRRALEEQVAMRLGLERPASRRELVTRARGQGLLGESDARDLDRILAKLRVESDDREARFRRRLRGAEILALLERSRGLLEAMDQARRDRLSASP